MFAKAFVPITIVTLSSALLLTGCSAQTDTNQDGESQIQVEMTPERLEELKEMQSSLVATEANLSTIAAPTPKYEQNLDIWKMINPSGQGKLYLEDSSIRDKSLRDIQASSDMFSLYNAESGSDVDETQKRVLEFLAANPGATEVDSAAVVVNRYPDVVDRKIMFDTKGEPFIVDQMKESPVNTVYWVNDQPVKSE